MSLAVKFWLIGQLRDTGFQRKTEYVQQQDLHLATSTVQEALAFSAILRQPRATSHAEKNAYVDEVIKVLEMEAYADAVVGDSGKSDLDDANKTAERGLLMLLYILTFLIFAGTFTNMVIAGIETAEVAGNVTNSLFSLSIIFCGYVKSSLLYVTSMAPLQNPIHQFP